VGVPVKVSVGVNVIVGVNVSVEITVGVRDSISVNVGGIRMVVAVSVADGING
jgi:hypothetical protein